jgi:general secretion pathway protein F
MPDGYNNVTDLGGAISSLVASGLPIEQGLRAAASELPRGHTATALLRLADELERGAKLDAALTADDRSMPGHLRALVVAGLRSASLGRVLEEFVDAERHAAEVYRKIMLAVSYPALLLLLMSCVFTLYCFGVVPSLMKLYEDFDADLPGATVALGQLSKSGHWVLTGNIVAILAAWVFLWVAMRVAELRTVLISVPLLGPVIRWAALARFSRLLALLIDAELPLPQALELAGQGCQDASLGYSASKAAASVRAGAALSDALLARRKFPQSFSPMIRWGERVSSQASTSALSDALRTAAEMFERRLEGQLRLLRAVVPPLSFLLVFWGALFLVSATMLPMISLMEKLT